MKDERETRVLSDSAFILPPSSLFFDGDCGGRREGQVKQSLLLLFLIALVLLAVSQLFVALWATVYIEEINAGREGYWLWPRFQNPLSHGGLKPLCLILLFGATSTLVIARLRREGKMRRDRLARGLCIVCGYDLRGSKDRCPECGMPNLSAHQTWGKAK